MIDFNSISIENINAEYEVRAHHGMCLAFFIGEGYSSDFTKNMSEKKKMLEETNPYIRVVNHLDIFCQKCPNYISNNVLDSEEKYVCQSENKVKKYDSDVLNICNIKSGTVMKWSDFSDIVRKEIILLQKRERICSDCQWNDLCK